MIKDYLAENEYDDIEIQDEVIASTFFRDYLKDIENQKSKKKKPNEMDGIKYYEELEDDKKIIVWHMISCLLTKEKREQNLQGYFPEMLQYRGIKREKLAKMVDAKIFCDSVKDSKVVYMGLDNIKSKIQNFAKVMHSKEDSYLLNEVCSVLHIDYDAIAYGFGTEYELDEEELMYQISKKGYKTKEFLEEFVSDYVPCEKCTNKRYCNGQKEYFDYLQSDVVSLSKALSDKLGIEQEKLLISKPIVIEANELPFKKYYDKLSKDGKKIIYYLIRDLYALDLKNGGYQSEE